jgi:CRISPR-associated protein Cas1
MASAGQRPASSPRELARISDRTSFIYLERCTVHRDANAITAQDADGIRHIPSATIGTLLLGPGTRITHQAMSVLGETGAAVIWVGEQGVRYYAGGRSLSRTSLLAEAHAACWANRHTRLDVARAMYGLRFPDDDPAGFTRQELLGREGRRVKDCYQQQSERTGVVWRGRRYTPGDFTSGDAVNQAITAAAQVTYGISHAVITALGCIPALGFIHSGHDLSFVLDVADLYKTELGIPIAFEVAAESAEDVGSRTRRALRDQIYERHLLDRIVRDVKGLLLRDAKGASAVDGADADRVTLRSDRDVEVEAGVNYAFEDSW